MERAVSGACEHAPYEPQTLALLMRPLESRSLQVLTKTRPFGPARAAMLVLGMLALLAPGRRVDADDLGASPDVWIVSTREATVSRPSVGEPLAYWHRDSEGEWAVSDLESFRASDRIDRPTTVFLHGNRANHATAVQNGLAAYRQIECRAKDRPFRFVIWSWPASRVSGSGRRDVQIKACRSDVQAVYLADWIDQVESQVPLSLVGYSFGARVVTGALHILGGGSIAGHALEDRQTRERAPIRAVLVAAALDDTWLLPGRRNELTLGQLDRLFITSNRSDPVLRWYRMMYRLYGPKAMGAAGPACLSRLGSDREKVEVISVSNCVGRNHAFDSYLRSPTLRSRLARFAFFDEPSEASTRDETSGSPGS